MSFFLTEYEEITSLTTTRGGHLLLTQTVDRLTFVPGSGYSCWLINVIDIETGRHVTQLHGGESNYITLHQDDHVHRTQISGLAENG